MTRRTLPLLVMIVLLALAGCGSASDDEIATGGAGGLLPDGATDDTAEGSLPVQVAWIVGTLKLEGTDLAVTADQAGELLFLWQAVRSLSESDSAAPEELAALLDQIEETMTEEQLAAIQAMDLGQADMRGLLEELDLRPDMPGGVGESPQGAFGGQGFPGEMPGGVPGQGPMGPMGPGQGQEAQLNPEQIATLQASRPGGSRALNRWNLALLDPLIELLEARAQTQG